MLFISSTPVLIGHLWQLKTVSCFAKLVSKKFCSITKFCRDSTSEVGLLNKRLILSLSFRCDQIHKHKIRDFGHALLCFLTPT